MEEQKSFPIPLSVGWILNILGWMIFISTMDHTLEFITAIVCMGCVYIGYKHKQIGTGPFMIDSMSAANLIYASAFEAVWMLCWALEIFWVYLLKLTKHENHLSWPKAHCSLLRLQHFVAFLWLFWRFRKLGKFEFFVISKWPLHVHRIWRCRECCDSKWHELVCNSKALRLLRQIVWKRYC